jgi:predicted membrane protein (TIGR00267 family)
LTESSDDDDPESSVAGIGESFADYIEEVGSYLRVTKAPMILRRYFAMNAFDGAMTSLGVVIGAYISHIDEPMTVIGVILVSGIAMAVSGFSGTYMTESAERVKSLNELEDAMLTNLEDTIYGKASRFVSVFAALVDGSAPFIASLPSVIPFYLAMTGLIPMGLAFTVSTVAALLILFLLGVFLGRLSESNIIYSGVKMVIAGVAVALIALLLNGHG